MRSPLVAFVLTLCVLGCSPDAKPRRVLRVCSDPNNLPFSNRREEGFENRIAKLIAADLDATVQYTWWPQRRGFIRNTLAAGTCDAIMGINSGAERVSTTKPYYRSTYVFVTRKDRHLGVRSLDDPALRKLRIGVQLIGDDYANTPPVHALSKRGIVGNVVGYSVFGDYSKENPPARIIEAVARGDVDLALAWGPLAGYFARHLSPELEIKPISPAEDPPLRFTFDISLAVRPDEQSLRQELQGVLDRRKPEIDRILAEYGIPVLPPSPS